jgi:hypothetical protein
MELVAQQVLHTQCTAIHPKEEATMSKIQGGCLCGAVRYTCAAEPVMTAICQCTHCQRQSGSAFSVNVGIPKGSLQYTGDFPATFEDIGGSGLPVHRRFCNKCGSPIVSEVEATPTLDWLKSGTLDDRSWLQPQVSVWCDSAQPWVKLPDAMPKFPTSPPAA